MRYFSFLLFALVTFSAVAESIPLEAAKNPESISYDSKDNRLYVSSFSDGAIFQIDRATNAVQVYQPAGFEGRTTAVGVKVDFLRRHLWVIDGKGVSIYDLSKSIGETKYLLARLERSSVVEVAAPAESFLNDVAIDDDGNGYITDSKFPRIYKVTLSKAADGGPKNFSMSVIKDLTTAIPFGEIDGSPFNLNGIVMSPDQRSLIVAKTNDGALYRISLYTDSIEEIKLVDEQGSPTRLVKADGLAWGINNSLYIIQNFVNKVTRIHYRQSTEPLVAEDFPLEGLKTPTGAVVVKDVLGGEIVKLELFITNSQFTPAEPAAPFDVLKVSLENL